jgi:hypothetical protein
MYSVHVLIEIKNISEKIAQPLKNFSLKMKVFSGYNMSTFYLNFIPISDILTNLRNANIRP